MENKIGIHLKPHGILREIHLCERGLLMKNVTSKSILIGNGININFGGKAYTNNYIIKRILFNARASRYDPLFNGEIELSVQEAKPLPDFTGTDDFFVSVTLNGLILDKAMLSVINRISERGAELLSTEDFLVIDALYHERPLNEKMQSRLNRLIELGIVEHIGRKKYVLARSLYAATGKTGVHTRHVGLDRDTNKELLLKHIRQNNEVGTPFKELQQVLPGLNRNQIQVLMRELKEDEKVVCKGKTSAARWFIIK